MNDLIFVSMEVWDDIWRRNQFICAELARRYPQRKILFVGTARNVAQHIRRRQIKALFREPTYTVKEFPNITVTRALRIAPDSYAWGRKINEAMARRHIRKVARKLAVVKPLLWLNPHNANHMAGRLNERGVVYDITDDWELAECLAPLRAQIEQQDRELCSRADLTIVCSQALADRRRGLCRHLLLLPNGVDAAHYSRPGHPATPGKHWAAPVFGYTGSLHPDRIDVSLITAVARAFPTGSVVLVGPGSLESGEAELSKLPNVHRPGAVAYRDVAKVMSNFDVCIVPHRESPFTESLNPIKLWEYLALGKPIVSSNVAGFRDFPELCIIASGPEQFVQGCDAALNEPKDLKTERQAVANENSWGKRVDTLLTTLHELNIIDSEAGASSVHPDTASEL